ncbi:MAG TPA: branched-chain amino acid ABC transporter permease [Bacillota bacterium]|nr:branched-chain amino acid ABC transporter permease [Bacillota bacterium]
MNKDYRIIIILCALLLALPWLLPNRYLLNIALLIGIYCLIVIGLNLLIGYAGQISLGHAAFYGLGAYTAAILTTQYRWGTFLALLASVLVVTVIAWLIGKPTLKLKGHYLAMATLGFGIIIQILFNEMVGLTGGPQGIAGIPKLQIFGFKFASDLELYYLVWGAVILVQIMVMNLIRSKVGRAFLAIHTNEPAAEALGIDTASLKLLVFVLSGALAGLAGTFYAYSINYLSPNPFGFNFSILLLTMVMVGGMGDLWGAILGTVLLGIIPELLRQFKDFEQVIYGILLILIVIFMPKGVISIIYLIKNKLKLGKKGETT